MKKDEKKLITVCSLQNCEPRKCSEIPKISRPGYEIPQTKESSAKHLLVFSSCVGRDGGRHKHSVIIAETEEQEPAETGHAALCVQESGKGRKISVYEFSPAYKIGCRAPVCAFCVAGQAGTCGADAPRA